MISLHSKFVVSIIDREFINDAGFPFAKTAIVRITDREENTIHVNDYGYMETADLYDRIDAGQQINLDNCYVKNFSMTAYRRSRLLHKKQMVELIGFSARYALFDSYHTINFSYTNFGDNPVDFHHTYFARGNVNFHRSLFGYCDVNFSTAVFRCSKVDFSYMRHDGEDFILRNAVFSDGEKDFSDTKFGSGNKSFTNVTFGNGDVKFINCRFNDGKVSFKLSQFGEGNKDFRFSTFGDCFITMEKVSFGIGDCIFKQIQIGDGKVNFNKSKFGDGDISFEGLVKTSGKFTIMRVDFGRGNINFERAEMENVPVYLDKANFDRGSISRVTFNRSKVQCLSLRSCHLDDYFDLRLAKCEYLDLSNTLVRDIVDLKQYDYMVDIRVLNIAHMRLIGTLDIDWNDNRVKQMILEQIPYHKELQEQGAKKNSIGKYIPDNHVIAEQFRILKENFNKTGRYEDEDKSYVMFKRFEQKSILDKCENMSFMNCIGTRLSNTFKTIVFDKMGQYATNPIRVMLSMIVLYMFFSLLYVLLYQIGQGEILFSLGTEPSVTSILSRSFYFSAISFLTIGYGDYYPTGMLKIVSSFEGFAGLFLMSYFTVAFVRKILR